MIWCVRSAHQLPDGATWWCPRERVTLAPSGGVLGCGLPSRGGELEQFEKSEFCTFKIKSGLCMGCLGKFLRPKDAQKKVIFGELDAISFWFFQRKIEKSQFWQEKAVSAVSWSVEALERRR